MPACRDVGWHQMSGRPGSGSEARHGSSWHRVRQSLQCLGYEDAVSLFAEFANKPADRRAEAAARQQMRLCKAGSLLRVPAVGSCLSSSIKSVW